MTGLLVHEVLERNARKFANREIVETRMEALAEGAETRRAMTYAELNAAANRRARDLRDAGVRSGDRVIVLAENGLAFVEAYFAALKSGAVIVPVSVRLTSPEVARIANHAQARVILHTVATAKAAKNAGVHMRAQGAMCDVLPIDEAAGTNHEDDLGIRAAPQEACTILYTSGTTGHPKGVLFSHQNVLAAAVTAMAEFSIDPDSVMLSMMPLTHSAPLHLFFQGAMYVGASHVLTPDTHPEWLVRVMETERVTTFFGPPVIYYLTASMAARQATGFPAMRRFVYGGAPVDAERMASAMAAFGGRERFVGVYGLTEAGPNGTVLPTSEQDRCGSIGRRAALHAEVRLMKDGRPGLSGEMGELEVRGEGTMLGYYKDPIATRETLQDGWVKTGDLARADADGYMYVVDRIKDVIISGGRNIYPGEVEAMIVRHPAIAEAVIVGVPHPDWGETAKACVVLKDGASITLEELRAFCARELANEKLPRILGIYKAFPRNANGKIVKSLLRDNGEAKQDGI